VRSAAAAGVDRILLSPGSADAWSPKALRAGMGGHFRLSVEEHADLLAAVGSFRGRVFATHGSGGISPFETDLCGPVALLLGAEGRGLSGELAGTAHATLSIPMASGVESLNVGAAVAVLLFERVRQVVCSGAPASASRGTSAGQ
jgi:TrmH family RNA methyltransferase